MPRRPADLLEVVVLARHAQTALVVDGPRIAARLRSREHVLELDHARVREQQRLVPGRHEAGTRDHGMATFGEELEEAPPDLRGWQRADPGITGDG
jgi:hypothetical protein